MVIFVFRILWGWCLFKCSGGSVITGVAIRSDEVVIKLPKPNRHHHCFAYCKAVLGVHATKNGIGVKAKNQGFITDKGVYLDRMQAMKHAKKCGQELIPHPDGSTQQWNHPLFSEDVW